MSVFSKWRTIGYAVAIFLAGVVSGGIVCFYETRAHMFRPPGEEEVAHHIMHRLEGRLQLLPEQVEQVGPIVARAAAELHAAQVQEAERVDQVFDSAYNRVAPLLSPAQRARLDQMYQEQLKRRAAMRAHWREEHPGATEPWAHPKPHPSEGDGEDLLEGL